MRALIYARVSSDPTGRGRSVADQLKDCRKVCQSNGWEIIEELQDNDTGASRWSTKDRPEYRRMHQLLTDADVLVTWEASRAHRDLSTYLELRDLCAEHGVLWSYSGRTYDLTRGDDRFTTGLDALMAEHEAERLRERVLRGLESRAAAGEPHGKIPYGYKAAFDDNGNKVRVPHPEESAVLRDMSKWIREGRSLRWVMRTLNAEERLHRGKPWNSIEIRRKLLSPTYAGYRQNKGNLIPATWEPIYTEEEHQAHKVLLSDPARLTQRGSDPRYLLTGIAQCGECGTPLARRKNKFSQSYACTGKYCVSRSMELVDELVERAIIARLSRPDVADALKRDDDPKVHLAFSEARTIRERLAQYEEMAIAGQLEPDEYTRIRDGLRERLQAAESVIDSVSGSSPVPAQIAGPDAAAGWARLPIETRRDVVKALCRVFIDRAPTRADVNDVSLIRIEWKQ